MAKWRKPARGASWPDAVRDRALELYRETDGNLAETCRQLNAACTPTGPGKSTVRRWLDEAEQAGEDVPEAQRLADVEAAIEARRAQLLEDRGALSELLVRRLAAPAAALIATRLESAVDDETLVAAARERYLDAVEAERMASEFGEDERRAAAKLTRARLDGLKAAERLRIDVRDLVGVLTRAVHDHLNLEGEATDEERRGDLVVELSIPRPTAGGDVVELEPEDVDA